MVEIAAHRLVAQTAKEMAEALYELNASEDNQFFKDNPVQATWVDQVYPSLLGQARKQLAMMLGMTSTPEHAKERIYEALTLDATIHRKDYQVLH